MSLKHLLLLLFFCFGKASAKTEPHQKVSALTFNLNDADLLYEKQALIEDMQYLNTSLPQLAYNALLAAHFHLWPRQLQLQTFEKSGQWRALANCRQIIAFENIHSKDFLNAALNYRAAMLAYLKLQDQYGPMMMAHNLSCLYYRKKKWSSALDYNRYALSQATALKDHFNLLVFRNLLLIKNNQAQQAVHQTLQVLLPGHFAINRQRKELQCYYLLGKAYLAENDFTPAKWFFVQAQSLALKINNRPIAIASTLLLCKAKIRQHDYQSAENDLRMARQYDQTNRTFQRDITALQVLLN